MTSINVTLLLCTIQWVLVHSRCRIIIITVEFQKILLLSERNPIPISSHSPLLPPTHPGKHRPTFRLDRLVCSGHITQTESHNTWSSAAGFSLGAACFQGPSTWSQASELRFFLPLLSTLPLCRETVLSFFTPQGRDTGCFHVLAVVNGAAGTLSSVLLLHPPAWWGRDLRVGGGRECKESGGQEEEGEGQRGTKRSDGPGKELWSQTVKTGVPCKGVGLDSPPGNFWRLLSRVGGRYSTCVLGRPGSGREGGVKLGEAGGQRHSVPTFCSHGHSTPVSLWGTTPPPHSSLA